MPLARFFFRVADAVGPFTALAPEQLAGHLENHMVSVNAPARATRARLAGATLAVNLAARLYPRVHIAGPRQWVEEAAELARSINPNIELQIGTAPTGAVTELRWPTSARRRHDGQTVIVAANGWNAYVDPVEPPGPAGHPLAELAAATLGMAEVFRVVFADLIGANARIGPQPGGFNLITGGEPTSDVPQPSQLHIPNAHLVGAGAIGQACLLSLIAAGAQGTLTIVDPEHVELSNLQRYLLTDDAAVGQDKTSVALRAAAGSRLTVVTVPTRWGADARSGPGTEVVLTALDSATDRIAVAAALPTSAYNAWTQPQDVGWSRHERLGIDPCLACLYYPDRPKPHEYELISSALKQHPLRVLSYLVTRQPVGLPLQGLAAVPTMPPPPEAPLWQQRSLLDDLIADGAMPTDTSATWNDRNIGSLYRDGVCGGGLVTDTSRQGDAIVPLAHQSALAGIMLATQFVSASAEELRPWRPNSVEARLNMMRGFPQIIARPRSRTPGCLCSDPVFAHHAMRPNG